MKRKGSGRSTKMRIRKISESSLFEELRESDFAARYLEEVLKDGSLQAFLLAVRNVARAHGGFRKVSKAAGIGRESLYKTLSEEGNPEFATLQTVLRELGLRFSVATEKKAA